VRVAHTRKIFLAWCWNLCRGVR